MSFEEQNSAPIKDSARNIIGKENILKTQIRLEEENGEKLKANKTEYIRVS